MGRFGARTGAFKAKLDLKIEPLALSTRARIFLSPAAMHGLDQLIPILNWKATNFKFEPLYTCTVYDVKRANT